MVRIVAAAFGVAAVVDGLVTAHHHSAATPLIVAGLVVVVLAVVLSPRTEIRASHGDTSVALLNVKQGLEAVSSAPDEGQLRERIAQLENEIAAAAEREAEREASERGPEHSSRVITTLGRTSAAPATNFPWHYMAGWSPAINSAVGTTVYSTPRATHVRHNDHVTLRLEVSAGIGSVMCSVIDPTGIRHTSNAVSYLPGSSRYFWRSYPDDFEGASLQSGDYEVEWHRTTPLTNLEEPLPRKELLATDRFSIG
jgi:hypothetical protein